jgi:hypothetical protein
MFVCELALLNFSRIVKPSGCLKIELATKAEN